MTAYPREKSRLEKSVGAKHGQRKHTRALNIVRVRFDGRKIGPIVGSRKPASELQTEKRRRHITRKKTVDEKRATE